MTNKKVVPKKTTFRKLLIYRNVYRNVWSVVKKKLAGRRAFTLKQLFRRIKEIWRSLPTEYAEKLVESMPRMRQAIFHNNGD